ncbi:MAG: Ig-like domain-containing protein [Patescibacteria group bacterium]
MHRSTPQAIVLSLVLVFSSVAVTLSGSDVGATAVGEYEWTQSTGKNKGFLGDRAIWSPVASSADGTKIAVSAYGGYIYTSADSGATWTKRTSAGSRDWQSIASSADGNKLVAVTFSDDQKGSIYTSADSGATWTERPVNNEPGWTSVASSSDGTKLAATAFVGSVYTSSDSGATWTQRASTGSQVWSSITSSADGTKLAAAVGRVAFGNSSSGGTGYIYTSSDSGATWTQRTSAGSRDWGSVSSSIDGTKLAAVYYSYNGSENVGSVYTSVDSGATWVERTSAGSRTWQSVDVSADGTKIVAVESYVINRDPTVIFYTSIDSGATWTARPSPSAVYGQNLTLSADATKIFTSSRGGSIFTSFDSGNTWTERTIEGSKNWWAVASSADGTKIVAAIDGGAIYTSQDSGSTWVPRTSAGSRDWNSITSSADGTKLAAVAYGWNGTAYEGRIFTSSDSGNTWTENSSAGLRQWVSITSSADGTKLFAGTNGEGIYVSYNSGITWTEYTNIADEGAWYNIAMTPDGATMLAVDSNGVATTDWNGGYVYISHDSGANWQPIAGLGARYWGDYVANGVSLSDNGQTIVVTDLYGADTNDWNGGYIYTSHDSGVTWTEQTALGAKFWEGGVAVSPDGQKIIAGTWLGGLHMSTDGGVTWSPQTSLGSQSWLDVGFSDNGKKIVAASYNGFVYTATLVEPSLGFTPVPAQGEEEVLPLPVNSTPSNPEPITNTQPTFSGVTFPNGVVTITVHSDPITCTTTADAQGNWSCTLPSDIPPGTHTINVELTNPITSEVTVLGPYYVEVLGDSTTITNTTPKAPNTGIAPKIEMAKLDLLVQIISSMTLLGIGIISWRMYTPKAEAGHRD